MSPSDLFRKAYTLISDNSDIAWRSWIPSTELFEPSALPWQPLPYMKRAVKFLLEHAAAGLLLDPGMRKTSITLAAIQFLKKRKIVKKVLIIAPLRVCHLVWPAEVQKWSDFSNLRVSILHGPKKQDALEAEADIYLINPEGLGWLLSAVKGKTVTGRSTARVNPHQFAKLGFDTLVIDELSKFKHPSSLRFKMMKQVAQTFKRRWGLTGSPASNGLLDLFGQVYMLDLGNAFGPYITHYRDQYFLPVDRMGYSWRPKKDSEKLIYARLAPLVMRAAAADYLELPALIEQNVWLDLPPEARRVYDQLEEDLISRMEGSRITAANAAAASIKCRQVASGGVYVDPSDAPLLRKIAGKRKVLHLHDVKTDALADLVDELQGKPLFIGYEFEHDLERLRARFKDLPYIGGGVGEKRAAEIERAWNAGELPMLAAHPASAGHGLNLQGFDAAHVAWYTLTWDYDLYDQFIKRILRSGNRAQRVLVYRFVMRNTVESIVINALSKKRKGQQALFEGLEELKNRHLHR